jgi:hypothetical protein
MLKPHPLKYPGPVDEQVLERGHGMHRDRHDHAPGQRLMDTKK